MLSWRCSTSCCGTTSPSPQTLSRRWWSCRASRSRPTSPPATASCSTCSTTRPCWRSASACWRRVYASWTPMHPSLVREHMQLLSEKERSLVFVSVFVLTTCSVTQARRTWSLRCYTACACWTWLCRRRWCSWTSSGRASPPCWFPPWSSSSRGSVLKPEGPITLLTLPGKGIQVSI